MEYLDIVDETGVPTGEIISRERAHRDGVMHRTAHVWITRTQNGQTQLLLQKRSQNKESFPGWYDTSSAGHIPAGCEPLESALRELKEELGLAASPESLAFAGTFRIEYQRTFHDRLFHDNEISFVYRYTGDVDETKLSLQKEELDSVAWFDLPFVYRACLRGEEPFCVTPGSLRCLMAHLGIDPESLS